MWFLPHNVGLMSNQVLVGYSHRLPVTIELAYMLGRTSLHIKGFVAGLLIMVLNW